VHVSVCGCGFLPLQGPVRRHPQYKGTLVTQAYDGVATLYDTFQYVTRAASRTPCSPRIPHRVRSCLVLVACWEFNASRP
jgi:hypothetical protein